ncbi:MAG: SusC/RagA family TonB-linked outer membrane protein [Mediterranea sp.]|jgi:TonB-linked SusC/RagA family outer membrane protein|nr:SusC/RagA family TonB-linked outer membrane protein [Mediterranea sp.]
MNSKKRKDTSPWRWSYLAISCLICGATSVGAQTKEGETQSVLMGTQDPELSIQSISTASGTRMEHRPTFQMEDNLYGILPGLSVGMRQAFSSENRSFSLRGRTPLIVVDGIPRSDANIPVSQIESVSVIKDALGVNMYGTSSGNGVIYIKTKRGMRSSMRINFTAQLAFSQQLFKPEFLDAYSYGNLLNQALINDGKAPLYSDVDLELYRTGNSPYTHPDVDWQKLLMRKTAPVQQYNLNFSGGGKSARYFIDLNVYNQAGFLKEDNDLNSYGTQENFKKYSLRANTDISITDHTFFKVNLFGQMYRQTGPGKAMQSSIYRDLYSTPNNAYPAMNPDGTLGGNSYYKNNNLLGQAIYSGYTLYPMTDFNIDVTLEHHFTNLLKGLYASATYSYNSTYREKLDRSKQFAVWQYWKEPGDLTPDDASNYYTLTSAGNQANGSSYDRLNRLQYIEAAVGYDFSFGKNNFKTKALYTYSDYIVSAKTISLAKNDISFRAEYNYDRRYLAEVTMSGMSMNTLKPGMRWGYFPAVGLGWNIHKEDWFHADKIDLLKLRLSYGLSGNDGTGSYYRSASGTLSNYYYSYIPYYSKSDNGAYFGKDPAGQTIWTQSQLATATRWEKIRRFNVGVDIEAFDRSLYATAEFFHTVCSDAMAVDAGKSGNHLIGIYVPAVNLQKYRQIGLELNAGYDKKFGDFGVTASANALFLQTRMLRNGENPYPEAYMQRVGAPSSGAIFGYVADGLFQSQAEIDQYLKNTQIADYNPRPGDIRYQDLNGDHIIDGKDTKLISTKGPRIEYGFYIGFDWKGIALNTQWQGLANVQTTESTLPFQLNASNSYGQALVEHLNSWTPENPNAAYPRVSAVGNAYNERTSTFWMKNSSYLRLKNIELSYTLPVQWTKHAAMQKVKIFANAYNLLTVTKLKNVDPELLNYSNGTSSGRVPNTRAFNVGLNIQF